MATIDDGTPQLLEEIRILRRLVSQLEHKTLEQAQVLEKFRHMVEVSQERSRLEQLNADVATALSNGVTVPGILQRCTAALVENLDAALARIWTLNSTQDTLELQASSGLYAQGEGPQQRLPIGQNILDTDTLRDEDWARELSSTDSGSQRDWAKRQGIVAFAGYPLIVDKNWWGLLAVFAQEPLSQAATDAVAAIANQIAQGIERKLEK